MAIFHMAGLRITQVPTVGGAGPHHHEPSVAGDICKQTKRVLAELLIEKNFDGIEHDAAAFLRLDDLPHGHQHFGWPATR